MVAELGVASATAIIEGLYRDIASTALRCSVKGVRYFVTVTNCVCDSSPEAGRTLRGSCVRSNARWQNQFAWQSLAM